MENGRIERIVQEKTKRRDDEYFEKLSTHRQYELRNMSNDFKSKAFLDSMTRFVLKLKDDVDLDTVGCRAIYAKGMMWP